MFSIIIPLYNKELSIRQTLLSVLKQSYQQFEVIVVNDGSTDKSLEAVNQINDDRIRLYNRKNQGVSATRNFGVEQAKFDWVAFLDADDIWMSNHLEEILNMMGRYPDNNVYTTSFCYSDNRNVFSQDKSNRIYIIDDYFNVAINEAVICTNTIVVSRSAFNRVNGFNVNLSHGEDLELWAKLGRYYPIIKSQRVTSIYRVEAENRSHISKNIVKTHAFHLNLELDKSSSEYKYNKHLILDRFYVYMRRLNIRDFLKLKRKFPMVTYTEILYNFIKTLSNKLIKKLVK